MSFLRWIPLVLAAGLVGLFSVALFIERPNKGSLAMVGEAAPEFLLPALAPETGVGFAHADLLATEGLSRGPVSIVNVWASWCGPCVVEHPELMALSEEVGLEVFGINYRDRPEAARAFLDERGNPYDRLGVDENGRVSLDWGITGPPETFVVASDGTIIAKHIGALTPEVVEQTIRPAIELARTR